MAFSHELLKIYDRKIASGEITFSRSGIRHEDFTRLCIDSEYVIPESALALICEKMALNQEERQRLYDAAGYEYQD